MKKRLLLLVVVLLPALSVAEQRIGNVHFNDEPVSVAAVDGQQSHLLLELPDPGVSSPVYALKGMIRYDDVDGVAFLQMDNFFGDRGTYFTKSLAEAGPLAKISGSSDWRPFALPFFANAGDQAGGAVLLPDKLTLSLFLPGAGTVAIRDVALYQYDDGENPLLASGQWFSDDAAGLFGGIGGAVIGVWGALIGILSGRGRARSFVLGSANLLLVFGVACVVGGIAALATSQPGSVHYMLLLLGFIVVVVFGKLRGTLAARYEQLELQRMQAMDA